MNKLIPVKEFEELLNTALNKDKASSAKAMKDIVKSYKYRMPTAAAKRVIKILPQHQPYYDNQYHYDALLRLLGLVIWSSSRSQSLTIIKPVATEMTIAGLQHPSGTSKAICTPNRE